MHYYNDAIKKYIEINGRTSKRGYWMFVLYNSLFGIAYFIVSIIVSIILFQIIAIHSLIFTIIILLIPLFLYSAFIAIPNFTITIRRLHDINKSWWWIFISLIPIIGGLWLLILLLRNGDNGRNKYGEAPVEIIGKPVQWRKIVTIIIFVLFGVTVIIFFVFMLNDSKELELQKNVNEKNRIMNEEEVNSIVLPASFRIETTSKRSNEGGDKIESKGELTFMYGNVTKGEFVYKVQEGEHCKANCYHEDNCVINNSIWTGPNLEKNAYCSNLDLPTILAIRKNIAHGYYVPIERCSAGLITCYKITEIK